MQHEAMVAGGTSRPLYRRMPGHAVWREHTRAAATETTSQPRRHLPTFDRPTDESAHSVDANEGIHITN